MKALVLSLALVAAASLSPRIHAHADQDHVAASATTAHINAKQAATRAALRDLWVEHVFWIRNYVTASASSSATQQQVASDQVVANAKAIAAAVASFYGPAAGDRMLTLLAGHWGAVKDYSDATFRKDAGGIL